MKIVSGLQESPLTTQSLEPISPKFMGRAPFGVDFHPETIFMEQPKGSKDKTLHYTVWIKDKGQHLRLDARGVDFQITDERGHDLGIVSPWVAPGA